jgi:predicted RND superfamily exporter protein
MSLGFAFVVLFAYTRNLLLTLIAIFSISFVMVSIICVMVLRGWEMGISESIALSLLLGLSVDYMVHLASHISKSKEEKVLN